MSHTCFIQSCPVLEIFLFLRSVMYQLVLHNVGCGLSEKNKSRISQLVRSGSVQLRGSHHILQFSLLIHGRHDAHRALVVHLVLGLGQLSGHSAPTPQPRPAPSMRPNNHHPTFNWAERLPHFTKLPKKIPKQHILQVWYIQGDFFDWCCPKSSKCWRWQNPY